MAIPSWFILLIIGVVGLLIYFLMFRKKGAPSVPAVPPETPVEEETLSETPGL